MPDDFIEIANTQKVILSSAIGNGDKAVERIFTNRRTYDRLPDDMKQRIVINTAEQMTLF